MQKLLIMVLALSMMLAGCGGRSTKNSDCDLLWRGLTNDYTLDDLQAGRLFATLKKNEYPSSMPLQGYLHQCIREGWTTGNPRIE